MERRLVAIMATDVVGYSRLMGADESGVLAALKALRSELFDPLIEAHHGRIVKLMGDGTLVEFASVVDAVTCAAEIQQKLAVRNALLPVENRLELRIGVNLGDVMIDGEDLYGDGVNVAARLEGLAEPGSVYVSEVVATQVAGKAPLGFEYLSERSLKNIAEPVRVYRVDLQGRTITRRHLIHHRIVIALIGGTLVAIAAFVVWERSYRPESTEPIVFDETAVLARPTGPTVAVLAFDNLSGDPAKDYLSDGISEDVIIELGRYRNLNILSRQTTFAYRGGNEDVRIIGQESGADYVLEGTVRHAGERLRVTARLIEAQSRMLIWSEAFNEKLTSSNLFDVQLQITERVAAAIGGVRGAIRQIDEQRLRAKPPQHLSSYECTMFYAELYDRPDVRDRVRGCIERVVKEEPNYWRGWAQLAEALRLETSHFERRYEGTYAEKLDRGLAAADRAVTLNPNSSRARLVLGILLLLKGDRDGFFEAAEAALALGGDRSVEAEIGYWFVWTGRLELGAALLRRAIDLDPKSTVKKWHQALAEYHFYNGEYDLALAEARMGAQPRYWWTVILDVAILTKLGRTEEAERARDRLYALRPEIKIADIVWMYRRFQRPDALIAPYIETFRAAGIPEGKYRPMQINKPI
jgi:adenylate cyclase